MEALYFMLLYMPEDKTGTEWRAARCVQMLQLIISIISSCGCRSANVWHASASGVPVLAKRMMKWSQMGKEQNSFLRKKRKGEKKCCYECQAKSQESAPFHTIAISIPQRRKSWEKRKVTLQWPWNYWFHRESLLEKQAQLLWVLTSLGPDHCFQGSSWIHLVVFIFTWQFSHQLANDISTPCSAVSQDVTTYVTEHLYGVAVSDRIRFRSVFQIQLNHTVCCDSIECDQWHLLSGVTSALYIPWLICRSTGELYVT